MRALLFAIPIIVIAGCSDDVSPIARSTERNPTPQVDTDPTPQTGTGGPTQMAAPDTTTNGAPGAGPSKASQLPTATAGD
jgi:hypothetical protein